MLPKGNSEKKIKFLLTSMAIVSLMFLAVVIFLTSKNQIGLNHQNYLVSSCDAYYNFKLSTYWNLIQLTQFWISLFGFILGSFNFFIIFSYFLSIRKLCPSYDNFEANLSENRLKVHFILNFTQLIFSINLFIRTIEILSQGSVCNQRLDKSYTSILIFSLIALIFLTSSTVILFKLLQSHEIKQINHQEFSFLLQTTTLRENLFFNKEGYINEIQKLEKSHETNKTTVLKQQVIKNFPSGYKNMDYLTTRQIVYRLRGGKKDKNKKILEQQSEEYSIEFQKQTQKQPTPKNIKNDADSNKKNFLAVTPKSYQPNPNDQNYQKVQMTNNILSFSFNYQKYKQQLKPQKQKQIQQVHAYDNNQSLYNNGVIKLQKVQEENKLRLKKILKPKDQKKLSKQQQEEYELITNFNLAPKSLIKDQQKNKVQGHPPGQIPKPTQGQLSNKQKNPQNLDQNGNYYFVDTQYIKKKSKYLSKVLLDEQKNITDPNILYSRKQWSPKQKRIGKIHQKQVQNNLTQWQKIRKQNMLYNYEQQQAYTDSQQDAQFSSQMDDHESQQPIQQKNQQGQHKLTQAQLEQIKKQKANKLYLHMRRKKKTGIQHKYKLYEDQDGFYDDNGQYEDQQNDNKDFIDGQLLNFEKGGQHNQREKDRLEKQRIKMEDKMASLKNRLLQTDEARMLRFIRSKYVQPHQMDEQEEEQQTSQEDSQIDQQGEEYEEQLQKE